MKKKLFSILTLLLVAVTGAWAEEYVWNFSRYDAWTPSASGIAQSFASYQGLATNAAASENPLNLTVTPSSTSDKVENNSGNVTIDETEYSFTKHLKLNGTTSANRKVALTGLSGNGYITIVTAGTAGGNAILSKASSNSASSTNDVATIASSISTKTAYKSNLIKNLDANTTYYINFTTKTYLYAVIWAPATPAALSIKTQPVSAEYVKDAEATALTVEAQGGTAPYTYQWYSSTDAVKTSTSILTGETNASYTPSTAATGYYFCKVTDSATTPATVESNVATITISTATAPTSISVTPASPTVTKNASVTLTADVTGGVPSPTVTWYKGTSVTADPDNDEVLTTGETYSPSTASIGTFYYYAIASNSEGSVISNVVTLVINGSNACRLSEIKFSNGFFGEITQPSGETHGTIKAFYLSGASAPTVASATVSNGATYNVVSNELTVTAEDETTTAVYDITTTAKTPYAESGLYTFDGNETWVEAPNGYKDDNTSGNSKYGWSMIQPNTEERKEQGLHRVTLFLSANTSVTLISGIEKNDRNINVYVNDTKVKSNVKLAKDGGSVVVEGDASNPYLLIVEQSATGGDASIKSINIVPATVAVNVTHSSGYRTYASEFITDWSNTTDGIAAYKAVVSEEDVTFEEVTSKVPANTGLLIKAAAVGNYTIPTATSADAITSALVGVTEQKTIDGAGIFVLFADETHPIGFYKTGAAFTVSANTAYLPADVVPNEGRTFIALDEEATGISEMEAVKNVENAKFYNLAGQRVAMPTKGMYIVNGKKVIMK